MSKALLNAIALAEGHGKPLTYNNRFGFGKHTGGTLRLVAMTLDDIRALQGRMIAAQRLAGVPKPERSSAMGRYQFVQRTFDATRKALKLPGSTKFSAATQDKMATHLLNKRGLAAFKAGRINRRQFQNNLSMEWASLPRATDGPQGRKAGQSHYHPQGVGISQEALDRALGGVPHSTVKKSWSIIPIIIVALIAAFFALRKFAPEIIAKIGG